MLKFLKIINLILSKLKNFTIPLILLIAWIIIGGRVPPIVLPTLGSTLEVLMGLIKNGEMLQAWLMSMYRMSMATFFSVLISIPLGLLSATVKPVKDVVSSFTNFMRFIPVTVLYPMLLFLGLGETFKITFLFFATFFYFFPTTVLTFSNIDKSLVEVALTSGANKWKLMKDIYLPVSLPSLLQSFLMMYGISATFILMAESTNARYGLGHLILVASARGNSSMVFAVVLVIIFTAVVIDLVGNFFIKKLFPWFFATKGGNK